jgi:hypothetical protein
VWLAILPWVEILSQVVVTGALGVFDGVGMGVGLRHPLLHEGVGVGVLHVLGLSGETRGDVLWFARHGTCCEVVELLVGHGLTKLFSEGKVGAVFGGSHETLL